MFETYLDGEKAYPYLELSESDKLWNSIQSLFDRYQFIVKFISNSNNDSIKNTLLLNDVEELSELKNNKNIKILNLYLLHSGWKLEELSEIWEGIETNMGNGQPSYIYFLKNHSKYVISSLSTPETKLLNKKLIIKI